MMKLIHSEEFCTPPFTGLLISAETARALDAEASASWGLDPFALVEAAGRACARIFTGSFPAFFTGPNPPVITAAAGSGNNAADAMVMLRALILEGAASVGASRVLINRFPDGNERNPRSEALRALAAMGVPVQVWDNTDGSADLLRRADIIIDGIAGTGLRGPLRDAALGMVLSVNAARNAAGRPPFVLAIDIPSGNSGAWTPDMPILEANATLGIEPMKLALYKPVARRFVGTILPVGGVFPAALIDRFEGAERLRWESARGRIPPVRPDAHKYERGVAEIRAGSSGSAGAALIAAKGAQAAGAGIVRLLVDGNIYPILARDAGGVMTVVNGSPADDPERFKPDAILLGPGWGRGADREGLLEKALEREGEGTPLILDADAIALARGRVFGGRAVLTPHPGEFAAFTGIPKERLLADPVPALRETACQIRGTILFKSHVLYIAAADGRLGVLDGMIPVLASGGSGDLLAGFCAALAARTARAGIFDGYACAAAAAGLLIAAASAPENARRFLDPADLASAAASLAGGAWLYAPQPGGISTL
ncbi:MAG: bifunctional ADP-dependent NAD(P)H-hydrate dehydratase/NAD(P)H-hydrate epimerase [Treponema sp.]|jgi:NAD(P)H-hydrate epimerase|nr:bifunctional ADP-dependent NAD(P)H-hydrate dehydratase/NAD(P)H-hydrate epimerase [Treponema sp.]